MPLESERVINARVEMIESLQDAISLAHGNHVPWAELQKMTLKEVVNRYGQQSIRFIWEGHDERD